MKRAIIVHGWGESPENSWFPWLKEELEKRDYMTEVPAMPDTEHPAIHAWVEKLSELVRAAGDDELVLVGHSVGCQTILRTLEAIDSANVSKAVLVAAWLNLMNLEPEEEEIIEPWLKEPIDFDTVRGRADSFTVILSDNDDWVPFEESKNDFEAKLGANVIVEHAKGHMNGEDGVTELPSVLDAIIHQ